MNPLFQNICSFIDLVCVVNKGQAAWFGLAWLPVVCEKQSGLLAGQGPKLISFELVHSI